jgi:2,3-bisphosphoglycerate-independent phosphoglycerate mutase
MLTRDPAPHLDGVQFFFNGGRELQFDKEDRLLVPSPKVATYDLAPAMSSEGVAKGVADALRAQKYPFVCLNFAAPDMVGHTGMMEKAVVACEATDAAIGVVWEACREAGYVLVITSDHGNAEVMLAGDGTPFTAHTANKVPFIVAGLPEDRYQLSPRAVAGGELTDVAPTVLALMGIPSPPEMTGQPLVRVLS